MANVLSFCADEISEIARLQAERNAQQRGISLTAAVGYDGDMPDNKFAGYLRSIPAADADEEMEDASNNRYVRACPCCRSSVPPFSNKCLIRCVHT